MVGLSLAKAQENELARIAGRIGDAKSDMVRGAVEIGRALCEAQEILVKEGCKGEFAPWIERECQFSRTTAYRYIDAFRAFGKCPKLEQFQESALYVLAKNEEATKKAIALATKGYAISHEKAKELVDESPPEKKKTPAAAKPALPPAPASEQPEPVTAAREPGDDTEAIEAEKVERKAQNQASRSNGRETVDPKKIKEALDVLGKLVRLTDVLKIHGGCRASLEQIESAIKGCRL